MLAFRLLVSALCVQQPPHHVSSAVALRQAVGAMRAVVMSATGLDGFSSGVQQFQGGMLGVRARVSLDMDTRKARIDVRQGPLLLTSTGRFLGRPRR